MMISLFKSKPENRLDSRSKWLILVAACALLLSGCNSLSSSYNARLADHLSETGAKMYGAYWCPHCATQKEYFDGVVDRLPYVECDPEGIGAQPELCVEMQIWAYPTWIIDGQYYEGAMRPATLAALSQFELPEAESVINKDP